MVWDAASAPKGGALVTLSLLHPRRNKRGWFSQNGILAHGRRTRVINGYHTANLQHPIDEKEIHQSEIESMPSIDERKIDPLSGSL
jgi:hypothetical protein